MAKPARGLPQDFALDLPDNGPVILGDFLDEPPPVLTPPKRPAPTAFKDVEIERPIGARPVVSEPVYERAVPPPRTVERKPAAPPKVIRYQLNLTPGTKKMLEEVVEYVQNYSSEPDARPSEIFQGIIGLLHGAMDELDLSNLPRRGAWGSVTAKNFPGALGEAFEQAVIRAARKRGALR